MYPPGSRGRQASAPAGTRGPGRPISGAYGQPNNPTITRDEKSGGLMVNSTRMVRNMEVLGKPKAINIAELFDMNICVSSLFTVGYFKWKV